jgi:predicted ATPase
LREGLAGPAGATRLRCYGLAMLADALTRQGKHEAAVEAARNGLSTEANTGHRQWKAELHRLEGVALCALNRPEEGQNALEQAMCIARGQQAKAYELRAAMSLARLWCEQSKRQQARELLAPVYGWFIEGLDTRDLKEARALLDALAA